jgi:hypothetical protein
MMILQTSLHQYRLHICDDCQGLAVAILCVPFVKHGFALLDLLSCCRNRGARAQINISGMDTRIMKIFEIQNYPFWVIQIDHPFANREFIPP